jgi:archaellum biogenesis ATPase FlaH
MSKNYSLEIQRLFLEMFLSDAQSFVRVQNIYNPENFDRQLRSAATFLQEHSQEYKVLPTREQIRAVTETELTPPTGLTSEHYDWLLEEFEQFTRRRELERAILKSADLLEKGEYDPVEKLIKDAVQISLTKDMGTDYFENPSARLKRIKENNGQVSTGWPNLDRLLYGGFNRGELNVFAGGSGSGKSLFMQNISVNWISQGLNGVYITLELSEELCAMRIDSMVANISTKEIFKSLDEVEMRVRIAGKKSGRFRIKYMPAQSTVNDIRAYLKELQIQTGTKLDFIMVDYLDLLMPVSAKVSPSDLFVKDKYVSEEIRNLAKEFNVLAVTASQLNRCLALDTRVISNGVETDIQNVRIGDRLLSHDGEVTVTEVLPVVKQPVFEIVTKSGKTIKASNKHKFPTPHGLRSIEHGLSVGEKIYTRNMGDQS